MPSRETTGTESPGLRVDPVARCPGATLPGWSCLLWKARLLMTPQPDLLSSSNVCTLAHITVLGEDPTWGGHTLLQRDPVILCAEQVLGYYAEHHLLWGHACPLAPLCRLRAWVVFSMVLWSHQLSATSSPPPDPKTLNVEGPALPGQNRSFLS